MLPLSVNTPLESLVCNAQGCNLNTYLVLKQLFKNLKLKCSNFGRMGLKY